MSGLGEVDLGLSVTYSALLVLVIVASYLALWRRNSRD